MSDEKSAEQKMLEIALTEIERLRVENTELRLQLGISQIPSSPQPEPHYGPNYNPPYWHNLPITCHIGGGTRI